MSENFIFSYIQLKGNYTFLKYWLGSWVLRAFQKSGLEKFKKLNFDLGKEVPVERINGGKDKIIVNCMSRAWQREFTELMLALSAGKFCRPGSRAEIWRWPER